MCAVMRCDVRFHYMSIDMWINNKMIWTELNAICNQFKSLKIFALGHLCRNKFVLQQFYLDLHFLHFDAVLDIRTIMGFCINLFWIWKHAILIAFSSTENTSPSQLPNIICSHNLEWKIKYWTYFFSFILGALWRSFSGYFWVSSHKRQNP